METKQRLNRKWDALGHQIKLVARLTTADAVPVAPALATINERFALVPLAEEDVYLRTVHLCNDRVDRSGERFSRAVLDRLATTLPGKALLWGHNRATGPMGRFWDARIAQESGTTKLVADYYMRKSEANQSLRDQIDAGIVAYVSIGFRGGELHCDICKRHWCDDCPHWPGSAHAADAPVTMTWVDPRNNCEAVEGSLVWLGCQYDAAHERSLSMEEFVTAELYADIEKRLATATKLVKEFEERQGTLQSHSSALEQQIEELHRQAQTHELAAKELQILADEGRAYRADLIAEILRYGALIGAERESKTVATATEPLGCQALKEALSEYRRRAEEKFPPAPHTRTPGEQNDATWRPRHTQHHTELI